MTTETSPGASTCGGDYGGPTYVQYDGRWYVAGVTSKGSSDCGGDFYSALATAHRDWLLWSAGRSEKRLFGMDATVS